MNPFIEKLQPYPFEKLAGLTAGCTPPDELRPINLSIGEPKHPTPAFITEAVISHLHGLSSYPLTRGRPDLRAAIRDWLQRRFGLPAGSLDIDTQILPVNGTREALFALAQCVIDDRTTAKPPLVLMPNPFYQIYEGAALLAGAEPHFLPCTGSTGLMPDFSSVTDATWQRCQLLYLCSPGNPTGAVVPLETLEMLIDKAGRFGFIIAADECYSEIYNDEQHPPPGLLEAAARMGNRDYRHCIVFHSLSKRSNAPGLRSGFVAGDATILQDFFRYRTYHGCAMPPAHQAASLLAWQDERHVQANRLLYQQKFAAVADILRPVMAVDIPAGGFYLWLQTPGDDTVFARQLFADKHITVLPGSYLSRSVHGLNPGAGHVRMALVAPLDECVEAAHRVHEFVKEKQT